VDAQPVILEFVGAGDAFGNGGRLQACLSVRWAGHHVLVDCGATSLVGLKRLGLEPAGVDAVLVSHLHGDHFGGLPFLILDQQFARRERPLIIGGPIGTAARLEQALEVLFPGSSRIERRFRVDVVELQPQVATDVGPARVLAVSVDHASGAPALGLRLQCGPRTLAYSGDTAWTPALLDLADEADVFVCEVYAFDRPIRYHLDYATLRSNRAQLRCRRLLLTHLGPQALAHRAELEADGVVVADDGLRLEL
jgi:ribonuclease BN (tRNA processing enzyme)